jgi:hypothetical protein
MAHKLILEFDLNPTDISLGKPVIKQNTPDLNEIPDRFPQR